MDRIELQLCDIQGRLFQNAAIHGIGSAEFVKVFMNSATAKALDSVYNRMQWAREEYLLAEIIDEAGDRFEKAGEIYSSEMLYWIGYIYRYCHYYMKESSKEIYKQASIKIMQRCYERYYFWTPEEVIDKIKESANDL